MVLRVPFEEFAETVVRLMSRPEAYVETVSCGTKLTACVPLGGVLVVCVTSLPEAAVRKRLEDSEIPCLPGQWSAVDDVDVCTDTPGEVFVVAIAYTSRDSRPGLWVDAFPFEPTPLQALRAMFEEFRANGEIGDVTFEDFVKRSNASVVVSTKEQIDDWARSKSDAEAVSSSDVGDQPNAAQA